jgi:DNA polymerase-3 subunit alpha
MKHEQTLYQLLSEYDGNDTVCIYLECEKAIKRLPKNRNINIENELLNKLALKYGESNIQVLEKSIEKGHKMN